MTFHIPTPKSCPQANAAIAQEMAADCIALLHASCGYPALSTFSTAIDAGNFTTWPGLSSDQLRKHPPQSLSMAKGHLDQQRKNTRSTRGKPTIISGPAETKGDYHPHPPPQHQKTNHIFAECFPISGLVFTDQPGEFLVPSTNGMKYMMVLYEYDSNSILAEPMRSRSGPEMTRAYEALHGQLTSRGFQPRLQQLDNQASALLTAFLDDKQVDYQHTPRKHPSSQRR